MYLLVSSIRSLYLLGPHVKCLFRKLLLSNDAAAAPVAAASFYIHCPRTRSTLIIIMMLHVDHPTHSKHPFSPLKDVISAPLRSASIRHQMYMHFLHPISAF